jgi:hypothetical protein
MRDVPEVHLYRVNSMMLYIYLILLLRVAAVFIIISTVFIIANSLEEVDNEPKKRKSKFKLQRATLNASLVLQTNPTIGQ